jgi:hypothetical protein
MNDYTFYLTPEGIKAQAKKILELTNNGHTCFIVHQEKIESLADQLAERTRTRFVDRPIPFHSRFRHLENLSTFQAIESTLSEKPDERLKQYFEILIPSVLLDAGAGNEWSFKSQGQTYTRSEGLAVAALELTIQKNLTASHGFFADSKGLCDLKLETLERVFQVNAQNPLEGTQGRLNLLHRLGRRLESMPDQFPGQSLGELADPIIRGEVKDAKALLQYVLEVFNPIWPQGLEIDGTYLGDVWKYQNSSTNDSLLVPFHKLSQWLTYSLIEACHRCGFHMTGTDQLTALAEYRNGGLLVDAGCIELKDEKHKNQKHLPSSQLIIEWRALTIALIDQIYQLVGQKLGKTPQDFPLVQLLEVGTWSLGRELAFAARPDGRSPIQIDSDGTVF